MLKTKDIPLIIGNPEIDIPCIPPTHIPTRTIWFDLFYDAKSFQIRQEIKKLEIILATPSFNSVLYMICSMTKTLIQLQKGYMD